MQIYSDSRSEVIYQLLALLPIIEEGLMHMQTQLEELRLEESTALFQDAAMGIGIIANHLPPLLDNNHNQDLLDKTIQVRTAITILIDAYEQNELLVIQTTLNSHLLPAFTAWQLELLSLFSPAVMS